jgi:hypothetical protein
LARLFDWKLDWIVELSAYKLEQMSELLKATQEVMETHTGSLAFRMDMQQARALTVQAEMKAEMDSHHDKLMTIMKAGKRPRARPV